MSDSYANRLSKGVDYGVCGLPELYDTDEDLEIKLQRLVDLVRASKFTVVHTGAGW
jgi:mono-ADP-ribosyltransferase sirtuin 6